MELCVECNRRPIQNKKRGRCFSCYSKWYRRARERGEKVDGPNLTHSEWQENLEKRYPSIMEEIAKLFQNPYWTLQAIAEKYGITREYIRQVFNRLYNAGIKNGLLEWRQNVKLENEMGCIYDPRQKVIRYAEGLILKGAIAEKIVFEQCEALGFKVKPGSDMIYDLKINGLKVDVKSSWKATKTNPQSNRTYHFGISSKQKKVCDFLICVKMPQAEAYIIPSSEFPKSKKAGSIYIRKNLNNKRKNWPVSRWEQYKEAWHLLIRA